MNLDKLAAMVQNGFEEINQKVDVGFEEIKLKLDNVAYRFEIRELQRRVELLEKKANFKK